MALKLKKFKIICDRKFNFDWVEQPFKGSSLKLAKITGLADTTDFLSISIELNLTWFVNYIQFKLFYLLLQYKQELGLTQCLILKQTKV
jgi:hypothetical protein